MRALLLALVAVALASHAAARPTCVESLCADAPDRDRDGAPDGVVLVAGSEHAGAGVYVFRDGVYWQGSAEGDHEEPTYPVLWTEGWLALEGHDGAPAPHEARAEVLVLEAESENGGVATVAGARVRAHDHDGDGVPEDVDVQLLP